MKYAKTFSARPKIESPKDMKRRFLKIHSGFNIIARSFIEFPLP